MKMTKQTNVTDFAKFMKEVFQQGEKQEALSFNLTLAMNSMETTFDMKWIETFYKAESKAKTEIINAALDELSPEFNQIKQQADISIKDIRAIGNAAQQARVAADKAAAQAKVKAAQNLIRSAVSVLHFLKHEECTRLKVNVRKRLECSTKSGVNFMIPGLTFTEARNFGDKAAQEKGWKEVKVSQPASTGSTGAASEGTSVSKTVSTATQTNGAFMNGFSEMCKALTNLLTVKDVAKMNDGEAEALRQLEEIIIKRTYGDSKGKVDVSMLLSIYEGQEATPKPEDKPMTAKEAEEATNKVVSKPSKAKKQTKAA